MTFVLMLLYGVSVATALGVAFGFLQGGLHPGGAIAALAIGAVTGVLLAWKTPRLPRSGRGLNSWEWSAIVLFVLFALRSFLWLVFHVGNEIRVLSPNNLGDLSLHITYIREMANGVKFWPENPILHHAKLTYPVGVDLFHSLLLLAGADVYRTFVWIGLAGAFCTGVTLWRWGGAFTLAGFLCNGGIAGLLMLRTHPLSDLQSAAVVAWTSIPLALFVTQRGLLYAIPAGLALLAAWRAEYFQNTNPGAAKGGEIRFAGQWLLYGTMPLFHFHTFLFLSLLLLAWFIAHRPARMRIARLVAAAFVPATICVLLVTNNFHGPSVLGFGPGWMQNDPDWLAYCRAELHLKPGLVTAALFWIVNFGALPVFVGVLLWRIVKQRSLVWARAAVIPAVGIFFLCCVVKFAPWAWDNTKLMFWCYLAILPILWRRVLAPMPAWTAALSTVVLFGGGLLALVGGLGNGDGYSIASRSELDELGDGLRNIPVEARFAANPDYNHPLLLEGRLLAAGYSGHITSHGYAWREPIEDEQAVLNGDPSWEAAARRLGIQYLYWGAREKEAFPNSTEAWRDKGRLVSSGPWGEIYDLRPALGP